MTILEADTCWCLADYQGMCGCMYLYLVF